MKFKKLILLTIILRAVPLHASMRDTTRLFYNISQKKLSAVNKARLDSLNKLIEIGAC